MAFMDAVNIVKEALADGKGRDKMSKPKRTILQ